MSLWKNLSIVCDFVFTIVVMVKVNVEVELVIVILIVSVYTIGHLYGAAALVLSYF